jgi:ankyrin repeat protein
MIKKSIAVFFIIFLMPLSAFGGDNGSNLIDAAFKGDLNTVKQFLDNGVNPNSKNSDNETALKYAALKGHIDIVELLLKKGAKVNGKDIDGGTALMYAAWGGHTETVKLLLSKGANPNATARSSTGPTTALRMATNPLSQASRQGNIGEIVELLKKAGAKK